MERKISIDFSLGTSQQFKSLFKFHQNYFPDPYFDKLSIKKGVILMKFSRRFSTPYVWGKEKCFENFIFLIIFKQALSENIQKFKDNTLDLILPVFNEEIKMYRECKAEETKFLLYVAQTITNVKKINISEVAEETTEVAINFFRI